MIVLVTLAKWGVICVEIALHWTIKSFAYQVSFKNKRLVRTYVITLLRSVPGDKHANRRNFPIQQLAPLMSICGWVTTIFQKLIEKFFLYDPHSGDDFISLAGVADYRVKKETADHPPKPDCYYIEKV